MKITEFLDESLGWIMVVLGIVYCLYWFLGGSYDNRKVECKKQHEGIETNYNLFTGCWYWSDIQKKMINKDEESTSTIDMDKLNKASGVSNNDWEKYKDKTGGMHY